MIATLDAMQYLRSPSPKSEPPPSATPAITTPPLKSEKHPVALFTGHQARPRTKSINAVVTPSLIFLSTECFTPQDACSGRPRSRSSV